jgi:peptidyl-prolyl cis-trans isomerase D
MSSGFDARRFFSYFFILAIALVFVLQFGPGSRGCNAPLTPSVRDAAAKVNGKEIPLVDFRRAYATQLEALRQRGGGDLPEALARQLGIPGRVLDQLITSELVEQAADREGVTVSDTELRDYLRKDPSFQKDGAFDYGTYAEVLQSYLRKTPTDYEAGLRRRLSAGRLMALVGETAEVSDDELRSRFLRDGDTVALSLVRFDPASYAEHIKQPTAAEITSWEKAHGADIAAYYEQNKRDYSKGEQARARHILVRMARDASDAEKTAAHDKAVALRKEIQGGKDFGEVARASSDDTGSKAQGGELGWNERGGWVPAFSHAAFNLKIGEISEPVLTPFGWHIIQVEERKPAEEKPLASVSHDIAAILLRRERARALAEAEAKKALAALQKGRPLATQYPPAKKDEGDQPEAVAEKLQAVDTGNFAKTAGSIPRVGPAPELQQAAFSADRPGALPAVYRAGDALVVASVTDRQKADDTTFRAKKVQLREEALRQRQDEVRESYVAALRKQANIIRNESLVAPTEG